MSNLGPHEERKQIESDVFDGMNLIYITRLALKIGKIRVAVLESVDDDGTAHCILKDGKQAEYKKGEWSSSLEDAEKVVEEQRIGRLAKKQTELKALNEEIDYLKSINVASETKYDIMQLCSAIKEGKYQGESSTGRRYIRRR